MAANVVFGKCINFLILFKEKNKYRLGLHNAYTLSVCRIQLNQNEAAAYEIPIGILVTTTLSNALLFCRYHFSLLFGKIFPGWILPCVVCTHDNTLLPLKIVFFFHSLTIASMNVLSFFFFVDRKVGIFFFYESQWIHKMLHVHAILSLCSFLLLHFTNNNSCYFYGN